MLIHVYLVNIFTVIYFQKPASAGVEFCKDKINSVCQNLEPWQIVLYTCGTTVVVIGVKKFIFNEEEGKKKPIFDVMVFIPLEYLYKYRIP